MNVLTRVLVSEFILAFIIANIIFIDGVFLKDETDVGKYKKVIFGFFVIVSALSTKSITYLTFAVATLGLAVGIRLIRKIKMPKSVKVAHSAKMKYYFKLYLVNHLKPVLRLLLASLPATLLIYLASRV